MISPTIPITNNPEIRLDYSLRNLYIALRKAGCSLVAVEFRYRGTVWRVDTPEEAVRLRNELLKHDRVCPPPHEKMDALHALWTADKFFDVVEGIGEQQRRLLSVVNEHPMITSRELLQQLGLDSEIALAGVISGLSKQLRTFGISLNQVLGIQVKWTGKAKTRRFILDDFFRAAAIDQNWPNAWKQSTRKEKDAAATKGKKERKH